MSNKPDYELRLQIVDKANDDEVVISANSFVSRRDFGDKSFLGEMKEVNAESAFWGMFRAFRKAIQARYEFKHYADVSYCEHVCSGECRRSGCNCKCGEFHKPQSI